jgi:hypothetical protein
MKELRFMLAPAGYLIVQEADEARNCNQYRKDFGPYYGVDRLPPLLSPSPITSHRKDASIAGTIDLNATIEEWFDARTERTAFMASHDQALGLLRRIASFGFRLELLFCQLAYQAGEEDRLKDYGSFKAAPAAISQCYGFDVSWPTCNHSAILQPGVVPKSSPWRGKLNEYGLLRDYSDANTLRTEYLAAYPYPPFDVFLVQRVAEQN